MLLHWGAARGLELARRLPETCCHPQVWGRGCQPGPDLRVLQHGCPVEPACALHLREQPLRCAHTPCLLFPSLSPCSQALGCAGPAGLVCSSTSQAVCAHMPLQGLAEKEGCCDRHGHLRHQRLQVSQILHTRGLHARHQGGWHGRSGSHAGGCLLVCTYCSGICKE